MKNPDRKLNPFKKYAAYHTEGLAYLAKEISASSKDLHPEEVIEALAVFFGKKVGESKVSEALYYDILARAQNKPLDITKTVARLEQMGIGSKALKRVERILGLQSDNAKVLIDELDKIEQEVLADNPKGKDDDLILFTLAVAKQSVEHWDGERKKAGAKWKKLFGKIKKLPWKEDAAGGAEAFADAQIEILGSVIFHEPLIGAGIVIVKVVGKSIIESVKAFYKETKDKEQDTAPENQTGFGDHQKIKLPRLPMDDESKSTHREEELNKKQAETARKKQEILRKNKKNLSLKPKPRKSDNDKS